MTEKQQTVLLGALIGAVVMTAVFVYSFYDVVVHPFRSLFHWLFW